MSNTAPVENEHSSDDEERDERRDLGRLADAPDRMSLPDLLLELLADLRPVPARDRAGRDGVDEDPVRRDLEGHGLGQADDPGLGGRVRSRVVLALLAGDR